MHFRPAVPQEAFRTERAFIALRHVFDALTDYWTISNRDLPPAALAGWWDIAAVVNAVIDPVADLPRFQAEHRDQLIEAARRAQLPQRRSRKPSEVKGA